MIETPRLILRQWLETDYSRFAEMGANPELMRYFPKVLTRAVILAKIMDSTSL